MEKLTINASQARRFLVAYHGLDSYGNKGKERTILDYFDKVGSVQFDPLDICGKNAELVLQSRVRDFHPEDLYKLLYGKRLLSEGWDKMMCIYNMKDYPGFSRRRARDLAYLNSGKSSELMVVSEKVIDEVRKRGPLSSLDLDFHEKIDWSWAPAKQARAALEILFFSGKLAIENRIHSRRRYDLAERLIPPAILNSEDPHSLDSDYRDWRVLRRLKSIGLYYSRSGDGWLGTFKKTERDKSLKSLWLKQKIISIGIESLSYDFYIPAEAFPLLTEIVKGRKRISKKITFLAPLDNFMWDRFLIESLFSFKYRWEVYKPAAMREYGYYVLPVLYGDKIIARFEPVRDRKSSTLTIKNWWWEQGVTRDEPMMKSIEKSLKDFSDFLNAEIDMEAALSLIYQS